MSAADAAVEAAKLGLAAAKAEAKALNHSAAAIEARAAADKAAKKLGPTAGTAVRSTAPSAVQQLKAAAPINGVAGLAKGQWNAGQKAAGKLGEFAAGHSPEIAKGIVRGGAKMLPAVGSLLAMKEAVEDAKRGDYIGGMIDLVGAIPGPVGWGAMAGSIAWHHFHHGNTGFGRWDAPDGTKTFMLPAKAGESDTNAKADAALTAAQREVFGFLDGPHGTVWNETPPTAPRLDAAEVKTSVHTWLKGIAAVYAEIDATMQNSGEPYILQARDRLAPHFAEMAKLPGQADEIAAQLTSASDHASKGYTAVLEANKQARLQLESDGTVASNPADGLTRELATVTKGVADANAKLAGLFAAAGPAALTAAVHAPAQARTVADAKPAAATAPATSAGAAAPAAAAAKPSDDLNQLLQRMGHGSPMGGGGSPMGGGHGGGTPMGAPMGGQQGQQGQGQRLGEREELARRDDKAADKPKPQLAGTAPANKSALSGGVGQQAVPGAAAAVPPAGKPVATPAVKPGGPPAPVDVKGHKTAFPDAKTAKLGQLLAGADPAHPLTLSDAAARAGLTPPAPGADPGRQLSPAEARPGDVLFSGDKRYLMLGDRQFYDLDSYSVVGQDQLPSDGGDRGGYFRLHDPEAGGAPAAPVSGPTTSGVPFDVPGGHADSGVTSAGAPGLPKSGGPAPANAAATDTGRVAGAPSSPPGPMNPGAVK